MSGSVAIVGAYGETISGHAAAGHAYTFNTTTGDLMSTLKSPNYQTSGDFGLSVAVNGNIVIVGAPFETASGFANAGHAYAFNAETGALITNMTSPNPQNSGLFGESVAISGETVVVGAPEETAAGIDQGGNVYTFKTLTGALLHTFSSPNDTSGGGHFGVSVGIWNNTIVVGSPAENFGYGRAYTFNARTGGLMGTLVTPNKHGTPGHFGTSVAISGKTVVVGAPLENVSSFSKAGNAYTFYAKGSLINTLKEPDFQYGPEFGTPVSISGHTIVVGAPDDSYNISSEGVVFTYNAKTGLLIRSTVSTNYQVDGYYGYSVAISGKTILVGAWGETVSSHMAAGHAYLL